MTSPLDAELARGRGSHLRRRLGDVRRRNFGGGARRPGWHGAGVGLRLADLRSAAAGVVAKGVLPAVRAGSPWAVAFVGRGVLGHPTTRAHADRAARARYTKCEVFDLVVEAKKSGRSVTDDLFEEVGRKVGLARETTKKVYAAAGGWRLAARVLSYSKK